MRLGLPIQVAHRPKLVMGVKHGRLSDHPQCSHAPVMWCWKPTKYSLSRVCPLEEEGPEKGTHPDSLRVVIP